MRGTAASGPVFPEDGLGARTPCERRGCGVAFPIMGRVEGSAATFSLPSILAVIAAVGSFFVGAFAGFLLALLAIVAAGIGIVVAMRPSRRGGFLSLAALMAGCVALVAAMIKALMWLF